MSGIAVPTSRSGVRPALAFLILAWGLGAVTFQLLRMAEPSPRPARSLLVESPDPHQPARYTLIDRNGGSLAESVSGYALEASPFHLWLRHTPERIVPGVIAAVGRDAFATAWKTSTGDLDAAVRRALFDTREDGSRVIKRWPLTNSEGRAIADWIAQGGPRHKDVTPAPLRGLEVVRFKPEEEQLASALAGTSGPFFALSMRPAELFSEAQRATLRPEFEESSGAASRWVRVLTAGLFPLLEGPRIRERDQLQREWQAALVADAETPMPAAWRHRERPQRGALGRWLAAAMERVAPTPDELEDEHSWELALTPREWVFSGLMPRRSRMLLDQLPTESVSALRSLCVLEELEEGELRLLPTHDRQLAAEGIPFVGGWGWQQPPGTTRAKDRVYEPVKGLERAAFVTLRESLVDWSQEDASERFDLLTQGRIARLCSELSLPHRGSAAKLFVEQTAGAPAPVVQSSLDLELQRALQRRLKELNQETQTALSMGVVLDLESREVLALAWDDQYGDAGFAPLQHSFTPGSTFKMVTMSLALEGGFVTPSTSIDAGHGRFVIYDRPGGGGSSRPIGEAEGAFRGPGTAAEMLAHSSNAGMVQVGLRVPVEVWREAVPKLGYELPASPDLLSPGVHNPVGSIGEKGTTDWRRRWSRTRSHASVSFGHSISTNLLQHVEAVAALVDDGVRRPLRFVRGIQWGSDFLSFPPDEGVRVVSEQTVGELRKMLKMGAEVGTGGRLARPVGMDLWTKTGTTEKGGGMVCQHRFGAGLDELCEVQQAELANSGNLSDKQQAELIRRHASQAVDLHKRLRGQFRGSKSCYVSSIVAIAEDQRSGREVLVFIVANDPHWDQRPFGSWVAGPAAIDVLCAATGYRAKGQQLSMGEAPDPGFDWMPVEVELAEHDSGSTEALSVDSGASALSRPLGDSESTGDRRRVSLRGVR